MYRYVDGGWLQESTVFTSPTPTADGTYGGAVAVSKEVGRSVSVLAVGESYCNKVYVYLSEGDGLGLNYQLEATLTVPEAVDPQDRFGATVSIEGPLLVVGAPGLEAIYCFHRLYNNITDAWYWTNGTVLHSSEYDYDVINRLVVLHRQEFGHAIDISDRTVLVGAPFANYDKLGSNLDRGFDLVEKNWDTEGAGIRAFGKGKAFVFYSTPAVQEIKLVSPELLRAGSFMVEYSHHGATETTGCLAFDASREEMADALSGLSNVYKVSVEVSHPHRSVRGEAVANPSGLFERTWTVTFLVDWQAPGVLTPLWKGQSMHAENCTAFDYPYNSSLYDSPDTLSDQLTSRVVADIGPLQELHEITASDARAGDRFGWSVAIDEDQMVVGAPHSSAATTTSWDFETGTLLGWYKTGDAFDYQPTYGDNSRLHAVYTEDREPSGFVPRSKMIGESSNLVGLYFIGTFEKRPGYHADYKVADPAYPQGNFQGDAPTGTLCSHKFIVQGSAIDFQVGGGCNINLVYVELLVDGVSVVRSTGKCSEKMTPARFNVARYYNRAAAIRIVDNSTANWGHINVDHFKFDWDISGATIYTANDKTQTGGKVETPRSGAAYAYWQHNSSGINQRCGNGTKVECVWTEEIKLIASDKRTGALFGTSVSVNGTRGVVAVGSPGASFTGFYKEVPSVYPHKDRSNDVSNAAALSSFPMTASNVQLQNRYPNYVVEEVGAGVVWEQAEVEAVHPDARVQELCGAVYIYSKTHQKLSHEGDIVRLQHWNAIEHSKVQPPDSGSQDGFGGDVLINDGLLTIGSSGQDGYKPDAGSVYMFSLEFSAVRMGAAEFYGWEGDDSHITVVVTRDTDVYAGLLVLEYATSDLTAKGVDHAKYEMCMSMAAGERNAAGCGDYEQTTGQMWIREGETRGGFTINIIDDTCRERFPEYIQVTLSVPGSASLQGERLSAIARIDDNDYLADEC